MQPSLTVSVSLYNILEECSEGKYMYMYINELILWIIEEMKSGVANDTDNTSKGLV